jgi:glycosyltransferase involved in cell wall biosynthesis
VLDADMAGHLRTYGVVPAVIAPWVLSSVTAQIERARAEPAEPWTWLYSGNLGRAHEWETLLKAQAILEKRGADLHLAFQGGGPARPTAEARARQLGLRQCHWKGYVPEEELSDSLQRAQVLVVTQVPAAQGLLWPSKLRLVLSLPRPILWVGPLNGAIARELAALPWAARFGQGEAAEVAEWLARLRENPPGRITAAVDPVAQREAALAAWLALMSRLAQSIACPPR